jgi:hypothetical protein
MATWMGDEQGRVKLNMLPPRYVTFCVFFRSEVYFKALNFEDRNIEKLETLAASQYENQYICTKFCM